MNEEQKALNYLKDAIHVDLPTKEIVRRARLLVEAWDNRDTTDPTMPMGPNGNSRID